MTTFEELLKKTNDSIEQERLRNLAEEQKRRDDERNKKILHNRHLFDQLRWCCPGVFESEDLVINLDCEKGFIDITRVNDDPKNTIYINISEPATSLSGYTWNMSIADDPFNISSGCVGTHSCEREIVRAMAYFWSM